MTSKKLNEVYNALDFATDCQQHANDSDKPNVDKWLRRGIADLDFDPFYFLASGETSPEGWAVK